MTSIVCPISQGQPVLNQQQTMMLDAAYRSFEGKEVRIGVTKPIRKRSDNQNRYLWSVVYGMIAAETGHPTEDVHEAM